MLSVFAIVVLSQIPNGGISRGNFLPIPQYATTNALQLFVDPAGSDTNNCASTATPCQTVTGVAAHIPKILRNPVTVTFANGNYTGGWFRDFEADPGTNTPGGYIVLVGTLTTFTPATGTATGTVTSASQAGVNPLTLATMTDNTQTWTVNDLRGYIVEITGGTAAGQFAPIASNTATTITLAGTWENGTTPNATSTYAIRTWGANITTGVNQPADYLNSAGSPAGLGFENDLKGPGRTSSSGLIYIDSLRVNVSSSDGLSSSNSHVWIRRSRFDASGTGRRGIQVRGSGIHLSFNNSIATSANQYAFYQPGPEGLSDVAPNVGSTVDFRNVYLQSGSTSQEGVRWGNPGLSFFGVTLTMTSSSAPYAIYAQGMPMAETVQSLIINCAAGGSTIGIFANSGRNPNPVVPSSVMALLFDSSGTYECATGIVVSGPAVTLVTDDSQFQATAGTTALSVSNGSQVLLDTHTAISGSFTNELTLDDNTAAAFSDVLSGGSLRNCGTNTGVVSIP